MTTRRVELDPNRGNRRIPLSTVSAADLLGLNDDELCDVCQDIANGTYSPGDDCLGDRGCGGPR